MVTAGAANPSGETSTSWRKVCRPCKTPERISGAKFGAACTYFENVGLVLAKLLDFLTGMVRVNHECRLLARRSVFLASGMAVCRDS